MKSTREQWSGSKYDYLIYHEHLFVFRKPATGEKIFDYRNSVNWWKHASMRRFKYLP